LSGWQIKRKVRESKSGDNLSYALTIPYFRRMKNAEKCFASLRTVDLMVNKMPLAAGCIRFVLKCFRPTVSIH
jgi:hypothetical protein